MSLIVVITYSCREPSRCSRMTTMNRIGLPSNGTCPEIGGWLACTSADLTDPSDTRTAPGVDVLMTFGGRPSYTDKPN